ncbi:MAG TPA: thioredoxin [Spirochaetota bacterium]|nr:thioredoxin [Spirochaetota bacterium]
MSKEVTLTDATFDNEVLKSDVPALVDFWASWCGPCRALGPIIEQVASEYSGKVKVCKLNVDENPEKSAKYGIMSIPCIMLFKGGKVVKQSVGVIPKEQIVAMFSDLI